MAKFMFIISTLGLTACIANVHSPDTKPSTVAWETSPAEIEETLDKIASGVIGAGDAQAFANYLTDDYTFYQGPQVFNGNEYIAFMSSIFASFSNLKAHFEVLSIEKNKAIVIEMITGTHTGAFGKTPPTGKNISFTVLRTLEFRGQKIKNHWAQGDFSKIASQLAGSAPAADLDQMKVDISAAKVSDCESSKSTAVLSSKIFTQPTPELVEELFADDVRLTNESGLAGHGQEFLFGSLQRLRSWHTVAPSVELTRIAKAGHYASYFGALTTKFGGRDIQVPAMVYAGQCGDGQIEHLAWHLDFSALGTKTIESSGVKEAFDEALQQTRPGFVRDGLQEVAKYYVAYENRDVSAVNLADDVVFQGPLAGVTTGRAIFEAGLYELLGITTAVKVTGIEAADSEILVTTTLTLLDGSNLDIKETWTPEAEQEGAKLAKLKLEMNPTPILGLLGKLGLAPTP